MANLPLPKGFQRLDAFPLDDTSVFSSMVELDAYRVSASAYAGQICSVNDGVTVEVYKINPDKTVTKVGSGAGGSDPDFTNGAAYGQDTQVLNGGTALGNNAEATSENAVAVGNSKAFRNRAIAVGKTSVMAPYTTSVSSGGGYHYQGHSTIVGSMMVRPTDGSELLTDFVYTFNLWACEPPVSLDGLFIIDVSYEGFDSDAVGRTFCIGDVFVASPDGGTTTEEFTITTVPAIGNPPVSAIWGVTPTPADNWRVVAVFPRNTLEIYKQGYIDPTNAINDPDAIRFAIDKDGKVDLTKYSNHADIDHTDLLGLLTDEALSNPPTITGFSVDNFIEDTEDVQEISVRWNRCSLTELPTIAEQAMDTTFQPWLYCYELKIFDNNGTFRRIEYPTTESYTYTVSKNKKDGLPASRHPRFELRAISTNKSYSKTASILEI